MNKNIHILFKNKEWIIKEENNESIKSYKTKDEAIKYAKKLVNKIKLN